MFSFSSFYRFDFGRSGWHCYWHSAAGYSYCYYFKLVFVSSWHLCVLLLFGLFAGVPAESVEQ